MEHTTPEYDPVFDDTQRFRAINSLRTELGLTEIESSQEKLSHPTIGIEIEMTWMQAFEELGSQWKQSPIRPRELGADSAEYQAFCEAYDSADKRLRPILEKSRAVIPTSGADAYWEFAFLPTKNIAVTQAELALLYDKGILRDGETYATHMTIAGVKNERDAYALLCGLELSGGSTGERITDALYSQKGAWARRGTSGIRKRHDIELLGDDHSAYELRTLVISSFEQGSALLENAAAIAAIHGSQTEEWTAYRADIEDYLRQNDLELTEWGRPKSNSEPWLKYAALVDAAGTSVNR